MDVRAVLWLVTGGVVAGQLLPVPASWAATVSAVAVVAGRRLRPVALCLAAAAIGAVRLDAVMSPSWPAEHVARLALPFRGIVEGRIVAAPERQGGRTILVVETDAVGGRAASGRVRLAVRGDLPKARYGDVVRAETTLRRPRGFRNPGSFDLTSHLARRGIAVVGSVWDAGAIERRSRPTAGVRIRVERWRARIARTIARAVPGERGAVLTALVVGDDAAVDDALRAAFTRSGVVHVLSVSGLHVGLVAVAGFGLARWLLARSRRALLAVDVVRLAAVASLAPVTIYAALAGLEIATLRSATMVVAAVLALLLGRQAEVLRTLALAALVLSLVWPGTPREIAFQLSFVSVLAIVLVTRRFVPDIDGGWRTRARAAAVVSPAALAGTAPLTALWFQQVSLMALVANPLAIPLFGSVVVVVGLAAACVEPVAPSAAVWLFHVAGTLLWPGLALVRWLGGVGWAAFDVPAPTILEVALVYALLAAAWWRPRRGTRVVLAVVLAGIVVDVGWWTRVRFAPGVMRLTVLDVGQGDANVVELPDGRVLVVDAGGFAGSEFDTGAAIVAPFLATRKIMRVDGLVMTHAHPDHSGGLVSLLARRPRAFWWTGHPGSGLEWFRLAGAIATSGVPVRVLAAGAVPDPHVSVVHPPAGWRPPSLNDGSLVLRIRFGDVAFLLTGDAESAAEARMLDGETPLRARVLKVPHHGSRTSSGAPFLDAVAADVAVVPVGAENRYRLPNAEVMARHAARGTCVLRTDLCGAVTVETDGRSLRVSSMDPACTCPTPPP